MRLLALAALSALICTVGCGPSVSSVSGTVTLDGTPQPDLIVAFTPVDGGTSGAATTDSSGKYTLSSNMGAGVPAGDYKVSIMTQAKVEGDTTMDDYESQGSDSAAYAEQAQSGKDEYANAAKSKDKIPAKYNTQSTLTETVTDGANTIDFPLTTGE